MTKKIKLFDPVISGEEKDAVEKVFKSGFWASGAGTGYVDTFEKKISDICWIKRLHCSK